MSEKDNHQKIHLTLLSWEWKCPQWELSCTYHNFFRLPHVFSNKTEIGTSKVANIQVGIWKVRSGLPCFHKTNSISDHHLLKFTTISMQAVMLLTYLANLCILRANIWNVVISFCKSLLSLTILFEATLILLIEAYPHPTTILDVCSHTSRIIPELSRILSEKKVGFGGSLIST